MNLNPFSEEKSYTDPEKPLSPFASIMAWLAIVWVVGFSILLPLITGCSSAGLVVTLRDSSAIDIASISLEQSQWPVVSYIVGPTYYAFIRKDLAGKVEIEGRASLTNSTTALALYTSSEAKDMTVKTAYTPNAATTNAVTAAAE